MSLWGRTIVGGGSSLGDDLHSTTFLKKKQGEEDILYSDITFNNNSVSLVNYRINSSAETDNLFTMNGVGQLAINSYKIGDFMRLADSQTITGQKTFDHIILNAPQNPQPTNHFLVLDNDNRMIPSSKTINDWELLKGNVDAIDLGLYVSLAGTETITGQKTFSNRVNWSSQDLFMTSAYSTNTTTHPIAGISNSDGRILKYDYTIADCLNSNVNISNMMTTNTTQTISGQKTFNNLQLRLNSSGYADDNRYLCAYSTDNLSLLRSNYKISDCLNSNVSAFDPNTDKVILGNGASGIGSENICIGKGASGEGGSAIVIGKNAKSQDQNRHWQIAIGDGATCYCTSGIAIGKSAYCAEVFGWEGSSIAIGNGAWNVRETSIAIGLNAKTNTYDMCSIGENAGQNCSRTNLFCFYRGSSAGLNCGMYFRAGGTSSTTLLLGYTETNVNSTIDSFSSKNLNCAGNAIASAWQTHSDRARKKNVVPLTHHSLADILKLQPVEYQWKNPDLDQTTQYGFIAQDVEQIIPEIVNGIEGNKGISYISLVPMLVKAVQELQAQIDELKKPHTTTMTTQTKRF